MKQFLFTLLIVFIVPTTSHGEEAESPSVSLLQTIDIPVVEVITVDEEESTYEDVHAKATFVELLNYTL